jgi:hypothetical protein
MRKEPVLYLTSNDSNPALAPRSCWIEEELVSTEGRDNYLRVKIEPPIIGQSFGLGDTDIEDIVLATRYAGSTLHPVNEWPMTVFVCRILEGGIRGTGRAAATDLEVILIGELYGNLADANKAIAHESHRI